MAKQKRYKRTVHIPLTEDVYDQLVEIAEDDKRTLADVSRCIIESSIDNYHVSFRNQIIKK